MANEQPRTAALDQANWILQPVRSGRALQKGTLELLLVGKGAPSWGRLEQWLPKPLRAKIAEQVEDLAPGRRQQVTQSGLRLEVSRLADSPGAQWVPGRHPFQDWVRGAVVRADEQGLARVTLIVLRSASGGELLPDRLLTAEAVSAQISAARYRFDTFRSARGTGSARSAGSRVKLLEVGWLSESLSPARARAFGDRSDSVASALATARSLGNTPPNVATPEWMSKQARQLGSARGFRTEIWGPAQLERRDLAGTMTVGRGSVNEPRFVRMRRVAKGGSAAKNAAPKVTLIGKGVTFDSGGISIKPSASMEEMKYDKCGACTALALACLLADLDLRIDLEVLLPFAENLPDARAARPSDIVTYADGTTVEIINTDAEGRLLLADALLLASAREPDLVLEFSTLTGAAVVAVGERAAAFYTPSDELAEGISTAADGADERFWRMPLWPEDRERMKGQHSDLRNSSDRWGSANTAAAFLGHFARDLENWAHLDIAGPAYSAKTDVRGEAGATGFGVLTGMATIESWLAGLTNP